MQYSNGKEKSDSVLRFLKSFLHLRKTSTEAVGVRTSSLRMADSYWNWNFQGPLVHTFSTYFCFQRNRSCHQVVYVCRIRQNPPQNVEIILLRLPNLWSVKQKSEPSNACPGHWAAFEVPWVLVVKSLPVTLMRIQQIGSCCLVGKCILENCWTNVGSCDLVKWGSQ